MVQEHLHGYINDISTVANIIFVHIGSGILRKKLGNPDLQDFLVGEIPFFGESHSLKSGFAISAITDDR